MRNKQAETAIPEKNTDSTSVDYTPVIHTEKKEDIDFYSEIYNGIQVNFITKNDNLNNGSPKTCGDVSMPCLASGRKVCVSELYTKLNYIFVPNTNKKCLEQFKKNYWQH